MNTLYKSLALFLAISAACYTHAFADEEKLKEAGQGVFEKHSDSVLFIAYTLEIDMQLGGQGHRAMEQSLESLGTVIRDDGLMVVPNSSVDIAEQIRSQIHRQAPAGAQVEVTTEIKGLKIILPDGSEIDGDVVLQDADLDFAFVLPKPAGDGEQSPEWKPVPLTEDAPRLKALDDVFVLGRMDRNVNRVASIRLGRIESAIRRPRLIYRSNVTGLGVPVFNLEGEIAGIFVRQSTGPGAGQFIIRTPRDVLKVAAQLKDGEEPSKEEAGESEAE